MHRALAMNRLVVGRREAICTTWREMGSARCAPEGPTAFSPRIQHADVHRVQVADELAGAFGAHAIVAHGLELEPGRDPSKIARLPTRSTPSCNNNPAIAAPLPLASRFPLEPSRPPDSTDARDRRRATASPRRRASARMASRRTRRGGTILLSGRAIDRKSAISVLRAAVQSSQLRMRLTSPIVRGPTFPVRSRV